MDFAALWIGRAVMLAGGIALSVLALSCAVEFAWRRIAKEYRVVALAWIRTYNDRNLMRTLKEKAGRRP